MSLRVHVNSSKLQAYLAKEPERAAEILRLWQQEGAEETANFMRGVTPVKSGFLKMSITSRMTPKGFSVYPAAPYAKFVEEDTQPHTIFPRGASVLRWYSPSGLAIFAKRVEHPGTKGQHFIARTREAMRTVLAQLYRMIWREKH